MLYLSRFSFPDSEREFDFFLAQKRTCHDSYYPFQVLSKNGLTSLSFEPVTILYGGNGCGSRNLCCGNLLLGDSLFLGALLVLFGKDKLNLYLLLCGLLSLYFRCGRCGRWWC